MFYSVLFPDSAHDQDFMAREIIVPPYVKDLGLDRVLGPLIQSKQEF